MKHVDSVKIILFLIILMSLEKFSYSSRADEHISAPTTAKLHIKLIKEISFEELINNYSFRKEKDNSFRLGTVLTMKGIYRVTNDFGLSLMKCSSAPSEQFSSSGFTQISSDEFYAVESLYVGPESVNIRIWNLKTDRYVDTEAYGWAFMSDNSILCADSMSNSTWFIDFTGKILNKDPDANAVGVARAFCKGFIGWSSGARFFDDQGKLVMSGDRASNGNFDVDYETGITAIVAPQFYALDATYMPLSICTSNGHLLLRVDLPFKGYRVGIGLSPGGKFAVVSCKEAGIVKLYDIANQKEIWSKQVNLGSQFSWWNAPIPVSTDAKYIILHSIRGESEKDDSFLILLDDKANIIDSIKDPKPLGPEYCSHVKFIPGTDMFVVCYPNVLKIYQIVGQ